MLQPKKIIHVPNHFINEAKSLIDLISQYKLGKLLQQSFCKEFGALNLLEI